tara:strand:+ start:3159 stop:3410 length:252 start_codon:yes stop_codon:yes gene_type:complete
MEKFKSKEEAQKAFEKEGLDYPKYQSGASKGKIKGSLDSLTLAYHEAKKEIKNEPVKKEEVSSKPVFHRGKPKKFNSFLFKKQ